MSKQIKEKIIISGLFRRGLLNSIKKGMLELVLIGGTTGATAITWQTKKMDPSGESATFRNVEGNEVLKIGLETYLFDIEPQQLPIYRMADGSLVYSGGLTVTKTHNVNSQ